MDTSHMTSREIVEHLCGHGDDVWQTGMMGLSATTISKLLEAWSKERKKEIILKNSEHGVELLDHVVLKDYDLTLWRVPVDPGYYAPGILYSVAINSEQHDPTDHNVQTVKFPGSSLRHLPAASVVGTLKKWIRDYGKLAIGTVDLRKLNIYRLLFQKRGLKVTSMPENPNYGFFIE